MRMCIHAKVTCLWLKISTLTDKVRAVASCKEGGADGSLMVVKSGIGCNSGSGGVSSVTNVVRGVSVETVGICRDGGAEGRNTVLKEGKGE